MTIKVLNLVPTKRPFFESQIESLESMGIEQTTISVPNEYNPDAGETRSVADYARFYPAVLRESFSSYDLIHANTVRTAPHALGQLRLPVVVTFWGVDVVSDAYKQAYLSKICAALADAVIVRNEQMATRVGGAHVIPSGVDMDRFEPLDGRKARDRVGWDHSTKHVLFPYVPTRDVKNYDLAEEVVNEVDEQIDQDVELQVVHGVSHAAVPVYMNAADLLLVTSNYEGSPNTVKEAMACNTPVVSTAVGDVGKRLGPVNNSYVCETASELVHCTRKTLEDGRRSDGRQFVEKVSTTNMSKRIVDLYCDVLETESH
jgi:glycosyltransferase involved in cell wall biosynthesis